MRIKAYIVAFTKSMVCFFCLILMAGNAVAKNRPFYPSIPWGNNRQPCWDAAGSYHNVDPWLLYAIAKVESGYNPSALARNSNGSVDLGIMQVNSAHWSRLRQYGIAPSALVNACASTYIGAWVLAAAQRRYGKTWKAIAAYNVGTIDTPKKALIGWRYAKRVYAAYGMLTRTMYHSAYKQQSKILGQ